MPTISKKICKKVIKSHYTQQKIQKILDEVPFAGNLFRTKKKTITLSTDKNINKDIFLL